MHKNVCNEIHVNQPCYWRERKKKKKITNTLSEKQMVIFSFGLNNISVIFSLL